MRFSSVSPSVYIAYHDLQAYISCPTTGYIARGKSYNTTIAYAPEGLSTSISARAHQTCAFSEINYTKLANYPFWNATDFILSLPGDLSSVDPAWSTCAPATYGAFDPPSTQPKATALTDPAVKSPSSTTPAPGGHVGPAYGPATTTSVAASSVSGVSRAVQKSAGPRRTNSQVLNAAKPGDPAVLKDSHDTASSGRPSYTPSETSRGERTAPHRVDPIDTSPIPGKYLFDGGSHVKNEQSAPLQTTTATATTKDRLNGLEPTLRLTGPTIPLSGQSTSSSKSLPPTDGVVLSLGGTTRLIQKDPVTLYEGTPSSPSGSSDEVSIERHIIHSIDIPAATASKIKAQLSSLVLYDIILSTNTTATPPKRGTLVPSSPFGGAVSLSVISPGVNASRYPTSRVGGETNGSISMVYTGGTGGSGNGFLGSRGVVMAFLSFTATALGCV